MAGATNADRPLLDCPWLGCVHVQLDSLVLNVSRSTRKDDSVALQVPTAVSQAILGSIKARMVEVR